MSVNAEYQLSTYKKCRPCSNADLAELEMFALSVLSTHNLRVTFTASDRMSSLNHSLHFLVLIANVLLSKQSMNASMCELSGKKMEMIRTIGGFPLNTVPIAVVSFSW
jgi:hypothetical protein